MDSNLEQALNTILSKSTDGNIRQSFSSTLRAEPPASDIQAAERSTGKSFASLRASGGAPSASGASGSASSFGFGGSYGSNCYCYNPCYSCPMFRRKLVCSVTYWPNWRLCCWFVWWWY